MKCVISATIIALLFPLQALGSEYKSTLLREIAKAVADYDPRATQQSFDPAKVALGKMIFEDSSLVYDSQISCRDCHLNDFASADGLPIAVGIGGKGQGSDRLQSNGERLDRNTLPLWGRGGLGFTTFFWDGRVESKNGEIISQFGSVEDAGQALQLAVHLPFAEFDEMIPRSEELEAELKTESFQSAEYLFSHITSKVVGNPKYIAVLGEAYPNNSLEFSFENIAESITHFIRESFPISETRFWRFLDSRENLTEQEVDGGIIFYGKGTCATCHSGPYFTDFDFHVIPTVQLGFGKNGFGVDYGRFNITHDPDDLYKFRTPPLHDVAESSPYMHSGSVASLTDAIVMHFDPLVFFQPDNFSSRERVEFYRKLRVAEGSLHVVPQLDAEEVEALASFLQTLSISN